MTDHLLRPAMHTINLDLPFIHHADSGFRHPQAKLGVRYGAGVA